MRFFDVGQEANGIIALGQSATGVIAVGQMATGVIAIGQLARGGIAIGQVSVGLVSVGMGTGGVFHGTAMLGIGGRGLGLVLPLVPSIGGPRVTPATTTLAAVHAGAAGWVPATLCADGSGMGLYEGGQRLPIKLDRRLQATARKIAWEKHLPVFAQTERMGDLLVCQRITYVPERPYRKPGWWKLATVQLAFLAGLGVLFWLLAGNDVVAGIARAIGADAPAPAHAPRRPLKPH